MANEMKRIDRFFDQYYFLSNFYPSKIEYEGIMYPTVEHAYQAAKSLSMGNKLYIRDLSTPGRAKRAGRRIKIIPDWNERRLKIMLELVATKFVTHPDLAKKLIETGDADLVEGNTWGDTYWGVCEGRGENHLGQILMKVRTALAKP
jgi:ribA/ribD-fused uncharacterized protein